MLLFAMFISDYLPFAFVSLAAAMVCAVIALYAWKRRQGPGIRAFALLMAALTWASLLSAIEYTISAHALGLKVLASQLYLVGAGSASVLAFLFAARYTHQDRLLRPVLVWLLWMPVLLELLLVFTNPWHHLYWPTIATTSADAAARVVFGHGLVLNLLAVFGYALLLLAAGLIVRSALRAPALYRRQSMLFVGAVLVPLVTNVVYYFDLGPWQDFDFTPVAFALSGMLLALAIFRYQAMELTPVALDTLFAHLRDGVLVVNERRLVVNANPAAHALLALPEDKLLGRPVVRLPAPWAEAVGASIDAGGAPHEVELPARRLASGGNRGLYPDEREGEPAVRTIEVSASGLFERSGRSLGSTIVLHDVTGYRALQRGLAQANAELEDRVAARTAELAAMRDSLAQHVANLSGQLSVLYEVILLGGQPLDAPAVGEHALEIVIDALEADAGFVAAWDPAAQAPHVVAARSMPPEAVPGLATIPPDWLFGERVPHTILDLQAPDTPLALRLGGMVACMTTAVQRAGQPLAAIGIFWRARPPLSVEAIALFRGLVDQFTILAENARLRQAQNESLVRAERSRLARDLHDSVTQTLYALALNAETTANALRKGPGLPSSEQLDGRLQRIAAAARQALREMRLLLYELRLEGQQAMHLPEALRLRLDAVEGRAGVRVETAIDAGLQLPPAVEADIYWIAMETLNNALKHAGAGAVAVSLRRDGDVVRLEIEDDGMGMAPDPAAPAGARDEMSGGLGLRSMRERAARLGGTLTVAPSELGGVAVHLAVPATAAPAAGGETAWQGLGVLGESIVEERL